MRNFSIIAEPLTSLLQREKKMCWTQECETAFEKIKAVLQTYPVLKAPEFDKPFCTTTDASDIGAGAMLLQTCDLGIEKPVAYFSKKFNKCQRN